MLRLPRTQIEPESYYWKSWAKDVTGMFPTLGQSLLPVQVAEAAYKLNLAF
jgi:hypothetical protein